MKTGARIAVGVGIGYLLGRTKKMRLALMLGAAGAAGRSGTSPGALVRGGLKQLGSVPEFSKLTEMAREELLSAAKSAAVSAASQRIDLLSERIQEGGFKKKKGSTEDSEADDREDDRLDEEDEPDEDAEEADDVAEDEAEEPADEEPERPKRRRSTSRRASAEDSDDDESDEGTARPRRSRAKTSRSPVRRGSGR
ncbi:hypothetical protein EV186_106491 [Labedaea rhizosphaerae]|uniref:DNA primase n=2 Tax=Labedaea rhizosphaerae TaxID=598644 RepID=A0A4R6S4Q7_LABRH|nr:hypothetical protein EV186_106491 [Labedaea rhizosphaerae]